MLVFFGPSTIVPKGKRAIEASPDVKVSNPLGMDFNSKSSAKDRVPLELRMFVVGAKEYAPWFSKENRTKEHKIRIVRFLTLIS